MDQSTIKSFYAGKSVFITGATGFVGKVLVEKLLRTIDSIDRIYILIRPKKGQTSAERFQKYFDSALFKLAIDTNQVGYKLTAITGDLSAPDMGLSPEDRTKLIDDVSVVFHVAGDVKFNEPLREAVQHNLIGTAAVMNLCKQMKNIVSLVHVSTAYAFCQFSDIKEKVYPIKVTPEEVIEKVAKLNDQQLCEWIKSEDVLEGRPNYYTFAKALAEHVVVKQRGELPTAIIRPSIVVSCYNDPLKGWIDTFNGPSGIAVLGSLGIMRIADFDVSKRPSFVPVDMTVNSIIAAGWRVAEERPEDVKIYHLASQPTDTPTCLELIEGFREAQVESPSIKIVRPLAGVPDKNPNRVRVVLTKLISHYLFAHFLDTFIWLSGNKPIMVNITRRMHDGFGMLSYFWMRTWDFDTTNTRQLIKEVASRLPANEAHEFGFDVSTVDWSKFFQIGWNGGRKYLLKEDEDNIPEAIKRLKRITVAYRVFLLFWYGLCFWLCFSMVTFGLRHGLSLIAIRS